MSHKAYRYFLILLIYFFSSQESISGNLTSEIEHLLTFDNRIKEQEKLVKASDFSAIAVSRTRLPTFSVTGSAAKESLRNTGSSSTILNPRDIDTTLTVPLFNVSLGVSAEQSGLTAEQAALLQGSVLNTVILEGVSAYINLRSAQKFLEYANESVENIQIQTNLQDAKISIGTGLTSNLLQAKTQLAGAEARRAGAELGYYQAQVFYNSLFGRIPDAALEEVNFSPFWLPDSVDECVELALKRNIDYAVQRKAYEILQSQHKLQRVTQLYPTVSAIFNGKWKKDFSGALGFERDLSAKLQLSYKFNVGGSGIYLYRSSAKNAEAGMFRDIQAKITLERSVKSAWGEYKYLSKNLEFLESQLDVSGKFLELARQEQSLGNRSLLDVLTGETSEINAASDYYVAKSFQKLSGFRLLGLVNKLSLYLELAGSETTGQEETTLRPEAERPAPKEQFLAATSKSEKSSGTSTIPVPPLPKVTETGTSESELASANTAVEESAARKFPPPVPKASTQGAAPQAEKPSVQRTTAAVFRIQLGTYRSAEAAEGEWDRFSTREESLLGSLDHLIVRADLGKKGIYYRLQVGPLDGPGAARAMCNKLQQRKLGCLVVRPSAR